jgi:hypothetical protein
MAKKVKPNPGLFDLTMLLCYNIQVRADWFHSDTSSNTLTNIKFKGYRVWQERLSA